jgi:hypothetical protein
MESLENTNWFTEDTEEMGKTINYEPLFDIQARDAKNSTALISASIFGFTEAVRALLECGADISATDKFGRTALHWAAQAGSTGVTKVLLEHQADGAIEDNQGLTAFVMAMHSGCTQSVRLMAACKGLFIPGIEASEGEEKLDEIDAEEHLSLCLEILKIFRSNNSLLQDMANEAMILACLGRCYMRLRRFSEAKVVNDLYVSLHPRNRGVTEISQLVHGGFCDQCDREIRGYRHSCIICRDYDLCDECAGRVPSPHPAHELHTIPSSEWNCSRAADV